MSRWAHRLVPDPFVLALGLTLLVMAAGIANLALGQDVAAYNLGATLGVSAHGPEGPAWTVLRGWLAGFGNGGGLAFALQMALVLVTGHALALSPPVQRGVDAIARLPRSTAAAALLVALVACLAAIVHWGLGAIVGALLAREIARHAEDRGQIFHYPLLGGAAYTGLAVWHGGISGSAPLKVAEAGHFVAGITGVVPVEQTIFSTANLVTTGLLLLLVPLTCWALAPRNPDEVVGPDLERLSARPTLRLSEAPGVVGWLQDSLVPGIGLGVAGLLVVSVALWTDRIPFDINTVNLLFLFGGLTLQGRIALYVQAVTDGARGVGGIVLQFPFYFGILGVMQASGLIALMSHTFSAAASPQSFPVLAFLSAGLVNLFVPSGGGQWVVQGDILVRAGAALGVPAGTTVMAFAYGDAWTNMLQPFWALPLLGIMGLRARDIIGYTAVIFVLMGLVVPLMLWLVF